MLNRILNQHTLRQTISIRSIRSYSTEILSDYERKIQSLLIKELKPEAIQVQDISGGCGSMFAISVTSNQFKGLSMIKQHKLVNKILEDEIKQWHGLQLVTRAPQNQ
ncbi:hypothetical protein WICMUC_000494 [Wickerhamomyces mucosus]|uniref:Bola-like protein n=1 Tax=Wickerhamomyces mucosus TaxID=1378264 RepID=A0A9P8PZS8_9ASCO|nr:hypothetical protein WICMUC_000494 [Wickerhamomyces mucosus]